MRTTQDVIRHNMNELHAQYDAGEISGSDLLGIIDDLSKNTLKSGPSSEYEEVRIEYAGTTSDAIEFDFILPDGRVVAYHHDIFSVIDDIEDHLYEELRLGRLDNHIEDQLFDQEQ